MFLMLLLSFFLLMYCFVVGRVGYFVRFEGMPKASGTRARVVVVTQGAESTLVASEGVVHEFPVDVLPKDKLVDTNGEELSFCFLPNLVSVSVYTSESFMRVYFGFSIGIAIFELLGCFSKRFLWRAQHTIHRRLCPVE